MGRTREPDTGPFHIYLDWFFDLSTCRNSGMGLAPISFTDIHYFATIKQIDDFDDFHYLMRILDKKYLELSDKDGKPSKNNTSN